MLRMPAIPVTTVQKMMGAMTSDQLDKTITKRF